MSATPPPSNPAQKPHIGRMTGRRRVPDGTTKTYVEVRIPDAGGSRHVWVAWEPHLGDWNSADEVIINYVAFPGGAQWKLVGWRHDKREDA